MAKPTVITLEYVRSFVDLAKAEFDFLTGRGFTLIEQRAPSSTSFRDGFHLRYAGPPVELVVDYYDAEFLPTFHRGSDNASYLFIDRYVFANASGYSGAMFPLNKLADAVRVIARDIEERYALVLSGDDATWRRIVALRNAPTRKRVLP